MPNRSINTSGIGKTVKVSREEGREPRWSRNGKQLFFESPNEQQMWVADIQTESGFSPGRLRLLFELNYRGSDPVSGHDISFDDQHFLMVKFEEREPQAVTILNSALHNILG